MATSAEIRTRAAEKLGILGEGETLRSAHTTVLDQAYTEVYAQLRADDLVAWDSDENVPDEFSEAVVAMVAFARANHFRAPNDKYQRLLLENDRALPQIANLLGSPALERDTATFF